MLVAPGRRGSGWGRCGLLAAALLIAGGVWASEPVRAQTLPSRGEDTVVVRASAAVSGRPMTEARQQAIERCLRQAVEQVAGVYVDARSLNENYSVVEDRVLTRSRGYVSNWSILEGEQTDGHYRTTVRAVVRSGSLIQDLQSMGILLSRLQYPRVAVSMSSVSGAGRGAANRWAEQGVIRALQDRHLPVLAPERINRILGDVQSPISVPGAFLASHRADLEKLGAEVLAIVSADVSQQPTAREYGLHSAEARVTARAIDVGTGTVLGEVAATKAGAASSKAGAQRKALESSARSAGDSLARVVTGAWVRASSNTRELVLNVTGVPDQQRLAQLLAVLREEFPATEEVVVRSTEFAAGEARLAWHGTTGAQQLATVLAGHTYPHFQVSVLSVTRSRIELRLRPSTDSPSGSSRATERQVEKPSSNRGTPQP